MTVALATIRNVEVATPGAARLWKGGERVFTVDELRDAVTASHDPEVGVPRLKLAHEHQLDTGEPSFGTYQELRWDDEKQMVYAHLKGVPLWLAKTLPTFYPNRSFEAVENLETRSGKKYKLVFRAIGSLGIKMPAVKGLADLEHWASADMPAGVTLAAAEGTDTPAWADTAIERETTDRETTVNIREKLGLPEDATDEQVAAKLDELAAQAAAGSPEALKKIKDEALAEAKAASDAATATAAAEAEAEAERKRKAAESGGADPTKQLVQVEAAALDELKADAKLGVEARAQQIRERREALLDKKIKAGAIAPASRDKLLVSLEAGAIDEETITGLADGVLPIDAKVAGREDASELEGADADAAGGDDWMLELLRPDEQAALKAATKGAAAA